jgi:hypothetical protein
MSVTPCIRWEWDVEVLDIEDGTGKDRPVCLGGATPPEFCGGPTGYRLMLKRQREGGATLSPRWSKLEFSY